VYGQFICVPKYWNTGGENGSNQDRDGRTMSKTGQAEQWWSAHGWLRQAAVANVGNEVVSNPQQCGWK